VSNNYKPILFKFTVTSSRGGESSRRFGQSSSRVPTSPPLRRNFTLSLEGYAPRELSFDEEEQIPLERKRPSRWDTNESPSRNDQHHPHSSRYSPPRKSKTDQPPPNLVRRVFIHEPKPVRKKPPPKPIEMEEVPDYFAINFPTFSSSQEEMASKLETYVRVFYILLHME